MYALHPKLTIAGGKIPKWEPRSKRGQYMGIDPNHAETVPLVRNLKTGYLSPQYHVVFDDWFETCYSSDDQPPSNWEDMCIFNRYETVFDPGITPPQLGDEWLSPAELASKRLSKAVRQGRRLLASSAGDNHSSPNCGGVIPWPKTVS